MSGLTDEAEEILKRGLMAKEFQLKKTNFSSTGTLAFGIQEHTALGIKYNPLVGIYGSTCPT